MLLVFLYILRITEEQISRYYYYYNFKSGEAADDGRLKKVWRRAN